MRSLDDALSIKKYMPKAASATVIGAGLLGLEISYALKEAGLNVNLLEFSPHILPKHIDIEGALIIQKHLEGKGINFLANTQASQILGNGNVVGVRLKDNSTLNSELVLISTGVRSRTKLAQDAGLKVNRGIIIDKYMQTSKPDIFAAGDVVEFKGNTYGTIASAVGHARIAAANMHNFRSATYKHTPPSITLKVAGITLSSIGEANVSGDEYEIIRYEEPSSFIYRRITLLDGVIIGVILIGNTKDSRILKKLIFSRKHISKSDYQLLSNGSDIRSLLD